MSDKNDFYHPQLNKKVSDHIREAILRGDFQPGEWIRQKRIADELGISQMPVREALKRLAVEGLVEHIPYRGVRVVTFSLEDIADLYAQRAYLEGRAAKAAAKHITAEQLSELLGLQTLMEQNLSPSNVQEYRELNRCFHQIVYRSSQRKYLIRTLDQLWLAFPTMLFAHFMQTSSLPLPREEAADMEEHQGIIAALKVGDSDKAELSVMNHILASGEAFIAFLNAK
ncbi:MAG TPA: GntR family transcriptional regulator [Chloroflexi bacterium]|nr:GntR family transcriptional regulator [Chloroflexota bacterium]HBY06919.1 GntR family transcriptional regulator [Chloroflexota bacterium]